MLGHKGILIALLEAGIVITACGGCGGGSKTPEELPAVELARRLEHVMPLARTQAAEKLAKLPPGDLKDVIPALDKAFAKEKDKQVKAAIKKALDAAKGGG